MAGSAATLRAIVLLLLLCNLIQLAVKVVDTEAVVPQTRHDAYALRKRLRRENGHVA